MAQKINFKKVKEKHGAVNATTVGKERALMKKEMTTKRICPTCKDTFTWRNTKVGQLHCSRACWVLDPDANKGGRPTVINKETLTKLFYVWAADGTDGEACEYAEISVQALQRAYKRAPELRAERNRLKNRAVLQARVKVVNGINKSVETAKWYLERKRKNEFAPKAITSGEVMTSEMDPKDRKRMMELLKELGEDDE